MRHVSRTQRVALDWLFESINFCICSTTVISVPKPMSKRTQADVGEERVTAKSKPMMSLVSRCLERGAIVLAPIAFESSVKTESESLNVPLGSLNVQRTCYVESISPILKIFMQYGHDENDNNMSDETKFEDQLQHQQQVEHHVQQAPHQARHQ